MSACARVSIARNKDTDNVRASSGDINTLVAIVAIAIAMKTQ